MYNSVQLILAQHTSAWSTLSAFSSAVNDFEAKLGEIQDLAYFQNFATVGVSATKNKKRSEVLDKVLVLMNSIKAYAIVSNDFELFEQVKITKTELYRGDLILTLNRLDMILEKAAEHLTALDLYGVDQATIDAMQAERDELEAVCKRPRNAIINRKVLTAEIQLLERDIDAILFFQLDPLAEVLRENQAGFYRAYKAARLVVSLKSGGKRPASPPEPDDGGDPEKPE